MGNSKEGTVMSLILDRCYFCLFKKAEYEVEDDGDVYHLCPECNEQFKEALGNVGKSPLELPRQDVSGLCRQCGLCCVVLNAQVGEPEAKRLLEQANATGRHPYDITMPQFCTFRKSLSWKEGEPGSEEGKGELMINFPCVYLKGSILNYVSCRVYDLDRPAVCKSYLCKIAVQYKLGLISLGEAKFSLRSSFMQGDVSIFNWSHERSKAGSPGEDRISLVSHVAEFVDRIKAAGVPEEDWQWAVAHYLTPSYQHSSDLARSLFNMHLSNVDHENFDLELYIPEIAEKLNERERVVALQVLEAVLRDIRALFIRSDEIGQPEEEKGGVGDRDAK